jgi:hypothetical protein
MRYPAKIGKPEGGRLIQTGPLPVFGCAAWEKERTTLILDIVNPRIEVAPFLISHAAKLSVLLILSNRA